VVFGNKFVYFLIASLAFYFVLVGSMIFSDGMPEASEVFNNLILPGLLIMFYPVIYNIQSDRDTRMLEIIFGIPNYRYKVYLLRFALTLLIQMAVVLLMILFIQFAVLKIHILRMLYDLSFTLLFMTALAFLFSTLIKNGNGAAVALVVIGLVFFFINDGIRESKWNVFINPYHIPREMSLTIWKSVLRQNRIILSIGIAVSIIWGLINLQRREKFV
jgi:hypothetical protein